MTNHNPISDEDVYWNVPYYDAAAVRWCSFLRLDFSPYTYDGYLIEWNLDDEYYTVKSLGLTNTHLHDLKDDIDLAQ